MWLLISVLITVVGGFMMAHAKKIDSAENFNALFLFIAGIMVTLVGGLSTLVCLL